MKRGILILSREELLTLVSYVESAKLKIAVENLQDENRILTTDEELENILDAIGIPEPNTIICNISEKTSSLLLSLRD
jgi:hypothetical protein